MENWKPIEGFEGLYMVSGKGLVKSIDRIVHRNRGTTKMLHGRIIRQQKGTFIAEWSSAAEASKKLNINPSSIRRCINGYLQTSGGYIWKNKI